MGRRFIVNGIEYREDAINRVNRTKNYELSIMHYELIIKHSSISAGVSKGTVAALGLIDALHGFPFHTHILLDDHLGYALAGGDGVRLGGEVDGYDAYFATVVGIDSTGCVDQR